MPFRLLYLPNEPDEHDPNKLQIGPRRAFATFERQGLLSALSCFSFLSKFRASGDGMGVKAALLEEVARFKPDVIFWQHVSEFPVDETFTARLRGVAGNALLVYHDEDPFDSWGKRITPQMRVMFRAANLVIVCGLEPMTSLFRRNGARNLRYLQHSYDNVRFGTPWVATVERDFDAVMIGSCIRRRLPPFYLPGGRRRVELARALSRKLGRSFALYGRGWEGLPSARGVLAFHKQEEAIRNSWVSVNWDHFDRISYYSSDRLPISLAAGVVHVTSAHVGYGHLFKGCPGLYACDSVAEVTSCLEWLLARPRHELVAEGAAAQAWAERHLEATVVYRRAIEICEEMLPGLSRGMQ